MEISLEFLLPKGWNRERRTDRGDRAMKVILGRNGLGCVQVGSETAPLWLMNYTLGMRPSPMKLEFLRSHRDDFLF